jgi:hypothetical protein
VTPRLARALPVLAAVALVAGPGGDRPASAASGAAATVNGAEITVEQYEEAVTSLGAAGLAQFVPDERGSVAAEADPTSGSSLAGRGVLELMVLNAAQRQFLDSLGIVEPDEQERAEIIAEELPDLTSDAPILQQPAAFALVSDQIVNGAQLAEVDVPDSEWLRATYEASPIGLGVYCADGLLVDDFDAAADAAADLAAGVARDDVLAEHQSARISNLACVELADVTDPELFDALLAAEPGGVVGPISAGGEALVLLIDTFEDAEPKLDNVFAATANDPDAARSVGSILFRGFVATSEITVHPRYGRWDATTTSVVALGQP